MVSFLTVSVLVLASFIADASCQRLILPISAYSPPTNEGPYIILPTYRPPPQKPIIRTVREVNEEPKWLWQGDVPRAPATGDHPFLPPYIDDVKLDPNRRYTRSLDSPSAKRYGGGRSTGSGGRRETGPTHPGYNRRNTRSIRTMPDYGIDPFRPTLPSPYDPFGPRPGQPRGPYPAYLRTARDIHIPGMKKPSHRDVIIPNWNPNARTNPWNRIGGRGRNPRSTEVLDNEDNVYLGYNGAVSEEE